MCGQAQNRLTVCPNYSKNDSGLTTAAGLYAWILLFRELLLPVFRHHNSNFGEDKVIIHYLSAYCHIPA